MKVITYRIRLFVRLKENISIVFGYRGIIYAKFYV
jgi:hypothetical protein